MNSIKFLKKNKSWILLFLFIIFLEITTFYWIKLDTGPPWWDQAWYLENSQRFYYVLKEQGFSSLGKEVVSVFQIKPPLISLLPLPFYFIFGNTEMAAMGVNLFFIPVFCIFLFLLVKKIIGEKEALLAVLFTSTMPLVYGLSRQFLVEYSLMAIVVLWLYLLIQSDYFQKPIYNLLLGIFLGLGLLLRVYFPLFILGPFLVILYGRLKKGRLFGLATNLGIIFLLAAFITYPWYSQNISAAFQYAISASWGAISKRYSYGNIFSFQTVSTYWGMMINEAISTYYFLLFSVLFLIFIWFLIVKKRQIKFSTPFYFVISWFLIPFFLFTFAQNKSTNHPLPILPPIGIMGSVLFFKVFNKRAIFVLPFTLLFPIFLFFYISYPLKFIPNMELSFYRFHLLAKKLAWFTALPEQGNWPHNEIIDLIINDWKYQTSPFVLIGNYQYFNPVNFNYYASLKRVSIKFDEIGCLKETNGFEIIKNRTLGADYLITKTGDQGSEEFNCFNKDIQKALDEGELPFIKIYETDLPDNSQAFVYKNLSKIPTNNLKP